MKASFQTTDGMYQTATTVAVTKEMEKLIENIDHYLDYISMLLEFTLLSYEIKTFLEAKVSKIYALKNAYRYSLLEETPAILEKRRHRILWEIKTIEKTLVHEESNLDQILPLINNGLVFFDQYPGVKGGILIISPSTTC